ncbi:target of Myb protein 1 [Actinidia rufa]|uniref:Target of Myb protein 1 n=1 Tax=Actinidia rufa TaxID=165716 RepID=A0A7J0EE78_9ERIC|nr:target of Myb protein 1 [Actinidia rufa]
MSDNLMEKVSAFGERLKISGAEVGRKMSAGMTSMSFKMKELFQGPNQVDKVVEEATAEALDEPDWATNLELCDMINHDRINSVELIRGIKKRIMLKSPRVQFLAMMLLETIVKNCEKAFSEVAAERVLDEMVKLIDDPQTVVNNRNKALILIEAWGESSDELRYLPVYEETYKSLKSRGIRFPGRDIESLAPIFTPPRSVLASESDASLAQQIHRDIPAQTFSAEQTKEAFDVARNSIELLTTVLSSSPQQDALEVISFYQTTDICGWVKIKGGRHDFDMPVQYLRGPLSSIQMSSMLATSSVHDNVEWLGLVDLGGNKWCDTTRGDEEIAEAALGQRRKGEKGWGGVGASSCVCLLHMEFKTPVYRRREKGCGANSLLREGPGRQLTLENRADWHGSRQVVLESNLAEAVQLINILEEAVDLGEDSQVIWEALSQLLPLMSGDMLGLGVPGRLDDLTATLVQQCRQSQYTVQRIIETAGDNEDLLFEALNVNDEIQKVLSKYEDLKKPSVVPQVPEPAMIPVAVEPDDAPHVGKKML